MRLLMTGGTGFVGQATVSEALRRGMTVGLLAREEHADVQAHDIFVLGRGPWAQNTIEEAMARFMPDAILHLAGGPSAKSIEALYEINVFLGVRLLEAARFVAPTARIVVVGSAAEYGPPLRDDGMVSEADPVRPIHAYGIAKLSQTLHALRTAYTGQPITVARLFNPVGAGMPSGLVFSDLAQQMAAGTTVLRLGDIDTMRDFMPVWEAARILVDLFQRPFTDGVVNVCSGRPQTVRAGVRELIAKAGQHVTLELDERLGARGGVRSIYGDTRRLRMLGIEPASDNIEAALHHLLEAYA